MFPSLVCFNLIERSHCRAELAFTWSVSASAGSSCAFDSASTSSCQAVKSNSTYISFQCSVQIPNPYIVGQLVLQGSENQFASFTITTVTSATFTAGNSQLIPAFNFTAPVANYILVTPCTPFTIAASFSCFGCHTYIDGQPANTDSFTFQQPQSTIIVSVVSGPASLNFNLTVQEGSLIVGINSLFLLFPDSICCQQPHHIPGRCRHGVQ